MKNILAIIKHDQKKIFSSVVAIIIAMGLILVPLAYAWMNIFSNWAPYEPEATGRISVAVFSEDAGTDVLGLDIVLGDKIIDALQANEDIGWVFEESSEKAIEGVRSGKYYAAIIIPADFSANAMSFSNGSFKNPNLRYYENVKKNAIAPKILGKAKTAVTQQINATFIETIVKSRWRARRASPHLPAASLRPPRTSSQAPARPWAASATSSRPRPPTSRRQFSIPEPPSIRQSTYSMKSRAT